MNIGITGENGFIGTHLSKYLRSKGHQVSGLNEFGPPDKWENFVESSDVIVHLAGINKGSHKNMIYGNVSVTLDMAELCCDKKKKLIYSSAICRHKNSYTLSKEVSENILYSYFRNVGCDFYSIRLPRVLGTGCKPFYNSFVATVAYLFAKDDLSYKKMIENPYELLSFIWVDDLCEEFEYLISSKEDGYKNRIYVPKKIFCMTLEGVIECIEGNRENEYSEKFKQLVEYYKTYERKA